MLEKEPSLKTSTKFTIKEHVELPPIPEDSTVREIGTLLANADLLIKNREYSLASHLIRKALYIKPYHNLALKMLIKCIENQKIDKKEELQIRIYKQLLKIEYSFSNLVSLGHLYYKIEKDKEALDQYYESLNLISYDQEELFVLYKNIGNILVRMADYEGAEEYYNKANVINPKSDVLLVNRGTLEIQKENYERASDLLREAVVINPLNDKAWVGLSLVHKHKSDDNLAFANIEKAIDLNPKNRTAVNLAAHWFSQKGNYKKAIEYIQMYFDLDEKLQDESMSILLIHLYCLDQQFSLALLEVERILLWAPNNKKVINLESEIRRVYSCVQK